MLWYNKSEPGYSKVSSYQTDILVSQILTEKQWVPRIVIECKLNSVSTHDAITYSIKASTHKNVHPYLRYGILSAIEKDYPLPGRLMRHGAPFEFMVSWKGYKAGPDEWNVLIKLLVKEVKAFRDLKRH